MPYHKTRSLLLLILGALITVACGGGEESGDATLKPISDIRTEPTLELADIVLTADDAVLIEMEYNVPEGQLHGSSEYKQRYGDRQKAVFLQRVNKDDNAGVVIYIQFDNPAQAEQVLAAMPPVESEEKHSNFSRQANFIISIETSASKLSAEQADAFTKSVTALIESKRQDAFLRKGAGTP